MNYKNSVSISIIWPEKNNCIKALETNALTELMLL